MSYNWDSEPDNPRLPGPDGEDLDIDFSNWIKANFLELDFKSVANKGKTIMLMSKAFAAGKAAMKGLS